MNFKIVAEKVCIMLMSAYSTCLKPPVFPYLQLAMLGGVPLLALRKEMSNTMPNEKVM